MQLERAFKLGPIERVAGEFGIGRTREPALRDRRHARIVRRARRVGAGALAAPRRGRPAWTTWSSAIVEDTVSRLRRRRDDRHARRSGVPAQRDPRQRSASIGCTFDAGHANQTKRGRARLCRTVRPDGAGGARPERSRRTRRCRPTSTTCSAAPPNLRGYDAGYKAGDNLAAASAELRIPITSPLSIGRFGVKAFADCGRGLRRSARSSPTRRSSRGIGGGAYLHLTVVSLSLDVARSRSGDTRFHFGMGVTFK